MCQTQCHLYSVPELPMPLSSPCSLSSCTEAPLNSDYHQAQVLRRMYRMQRGRTAPPPALHWREGWTAVSLRASQDSPGLGVLTFWAKKLGGKTGALLVKEEIGHKYWAGI